MVLFQLGQLSCIMRSGLINIFLFLSVVCSAQVTGRYPFSKATADSGPDSTVLATVWYLGENNTDDSSGNDWDGTYSGGFNASYKIQGSYSIFFNQYTWAIPEFDINEDTIAISFWYLHRSGYSTNGAARIAASGNTTNGWSLEADQGNNDVEFHKYVSGTDYEARTSNGQVSTDDTWYHVILQTYGSGGGYADLYVNTSDVTADNITEASGSFDNGAITMGENTGGTGTCVDNFAFFNGMVLTSDQRTYLYNHPETTLKEANE